jgi:hypothetical protein
LRILVALAATKFSAVIEWLKQEPWKWFQNSPGDPAPDKALWLA